MKKAYVVLLFLCIFTCVYSQKFDLIVTDKGVMIACHIDSITDAAFYIKMKYRKKWVPTNYRKDKVIEYKHDTLKRSMILFKPETSIIDMVCDENDPYQLRAFKLRNNGRLLIGGSGLILFAGITVPVLIAMFSEHYDGLELAGIGFRTLIVGSGLMVVGISTNRKGIRELERINSSKNNAFNGIALDLKPCVQYNPMTHHYQPGVTLRIRF